MSFFKKQLSFLLCLFLFVSINSCKKDLLIEDEVVNPLQTPSQLKNISLDELQQKIKIQKFDTYSSVMANNLPKDGKIRIREDLYLYTDKITMITANGVTSYTMAVQQNSKQKATFQNVTFVDRAGVIETYLLTYKASKDWAAKLRKDKKAPFEGYFSSTKLVNQISKVSVNKTSAEGCETFTYYYQVAYQCGGPAGNIHWPWEYCPWAGGSDGPGYYTYSRSISICGSGGTWVSGLTGDGTSGGGGSGGSTPTYPTLPPNYNPDCNYGYSVAGQATTSGESTSADGDGDCAYDNPNPAGLIANINKLTGILGLSWAKQEFLHNMDAIQGKTLTSDFLAFLNGNGVTSQNIDLGNWAIDFLIANPTYDYEVFKNHFLGVNEGSDGDYNAAFWEDPNVTFVAQTLPSFSAFKNAFPSHKNTLYDTPSKMYNAVGGTPLAIFHSSGNPNTCALRVSRALNYSGIIIPHIANQTFLGADGKYYFLGAANLNGWMKKTFGTPTGSNYLTGAEGGLNGRDFPVKLIGKQGIYIMIPVNSRGCDDLSVTPRVVGAGFCASGHSDILENKKCDGDCYLGARGGVKEIFIWELN